MFTRLLPAVVPTQIVMAVGEVDIFLVKDGCPLKRSACYCCCVCVIVVAQKKKINERNEESRAGVT